MAKGTITVDVKANTKNAQKEIESLRSRLEKTGLGELGSKFQGIPGLEKINTVLNAIPKGAGMAAGAIGGVAMAVKGAWEEMGRFVEKGREAQVQLENFETTMSNLQRNLGGSGNQDFGGLGKEL